MISYLPFKPIKGQQFTLYFSGNTDTNSPLNTTVTYIDISKDGGTFAPCSNSATVIPFDASNSTTKDRFSIVLTAAEMTADVVVIAVRFPDSVATYGTIIIYTEPSELSAVPAITDNLSTKLTAIWQYLILKRTVTATAEVLKKSDGSTTLATATLSDDGTTFSKGALS